jgi:small subunit ribosomal protein S1
MSEREKEAISNFKVGDKISGEVSGVVDFGAFVKFSQKDEKGNDDDSKDKLEGLVHISELAWQLIEDPRTIIKVGDKVDSKIIGIDEDKISLSIRALQQDPWSVIAEKYKVGDVVSGKVHKINHFGCFVYLDKDIHVLAHISEMSESFPGRNINDLVKTNEDYDWKILSVEPKTHRMGLVLVDKSKKAEEKKDVEEKKEEIAEEKPEKEVKEKKAKKKKVEEE